MAERAPPYEDGECEESQLATAIVDFASILTKRGSLDAIGGSLEVSKFFQTVSPTEKFHLKNFFNHLTRAVSTAIVRPSKGLSSNSQKKPSSKKKSIVEPAVAEWVERLAGQLRTLSTSSSLPNFRVQWTPEDEKIIDSVNSSNDVNQLVELANKIEGVMNSVDSFAFHLHLRYGGVCSRINTLLKSANIKPKDFYKERFGRTSSWAQKHIRVFAFVKRFPILCNVQGLQFSELSSNLTALETARQYNPELRSLLGNPSKGQGFTFEPIAIIKAGDFPVDFDLLTLEEQEIFDESEEEGDEEDQAPRRVFAPEPFHVVVESPAIPKALPAPRLCPAPEAVVIEPLPVVVESPAIPARGLLGKLSDAWFGQDDSD